MKSLLDEAGYTEAIIRKWFKPRDADAILERLGGARYTAEHVDYLMARQLSRSIMQTGVLITALRSIASNQCCDQCREAALVAQKALMRHMELESLNPPGS